jgi:hypothetical protein
LNGTTFSAMGSVRLAQICLLLICGACHARLASSIAADADGAACLTWYLPAHYQLPGENPINVARQALCARGVIEFCALINPLTKVAVQRTLAACFAGDFGNCGALNPAHGLSAEEAELATTMKLFGEVLRGGYRLILPGRRYDGDRLSTDIAIRCLMPRRVETSGHWFCVDDRLDSISICLPSLLACSITSTARILYQSGDWCMPSDDAWCGLAGDGEYVACHVREAQCEGPCTRFSSWHDAQLTLMSAPSKACGEWTLGVADMNVLRCFASARDCTAASAIWNRSGLGSAHCRSLEPEGAEAGSGAGQGGGELGLGVEADGGAAPGIAGEKGHVRGRRLVEGRDDGGVLRRRQPGQVSLEVGQRGSTRVITVSRAALPGRCGTDAAGPPAARSSLASSPPSSRSAFLATDQCPTRSPSYAVNRTRQARVAQGLAEGGADDGQVQLGLAPQAQLTEHESRGQRAHGVVGQRQEQGAAVVRDGAR